MLLLIQLYTFAHPIVHFCISNCTLLHFQLYTFAHPIVHFRLESSLLMNMVITGDTPPAPKRKTTRETERQDRREVGKNVEKLHDIMKRRTTSAKFITRGEQVLHDIMKRPGLKSRNVRQADFTSPRHLPVHSKKEKTFL